MKRIVYACSVLAVVLSLVPASAPAYSPPFPHVEIVKEDHAPPPTMARLLSSFRVLVNSVPYLLSRRLHHEDDLIVQQINDTVDAIDVTVMQIKKTIKNDEQKEIFAKLFTGTEKLKQAISRNLSAIEDFRKSGTVFDHRSALLIDWVDGKLVGPYETEAGEGSEDRETILKTIENIRLALRKAIFRTRNMPCEGVSEQQRSKARAMWDYAREQAVVYAAQVSSPREKELAAYLGSSLETVRDAARNLLVETEELNQASDATLALVVSLEAIAVDPTVEKKADDAAKAGEKSPTR